MLPVMLTQVNENSGLEPGLARLRRLAPQGFSLCLHIRFSSPHIVVQTYDPDWLEFYTSRGYALCDPVVSWGFSTTGASRWSEIGFPDPHDILCQAAAYGLRYGVAVSHGLCESRTIGGFARTDREFTDIEIAQIRDTVQMLHEETTPPENLTPAQRHALRLVSKGHRYAEAAALLGISESALKARLRSARERLCARTVTEAVQRAQEYNLL